MRSIGIITIHKINNYGSVLQAYALQRVCEDLGYKTEIIDYNFPNDFHRGNKYAVASDTQPNEPCWIKLLNTQNLIRQHNCISMFLKEYQHLSTHSFECPDSLKKKAPQYDVYITGSDQLWNPRQ